MVIQTNEKEFKGKTLQEYLNKKYPTKEEKEKVEKIDIADIRKELRKQNIELENFKEIDLGDYVNLTYLDLEISHSQLSYSGCYCDNQLTNIDLTKNVNLTYLSFLTGLRFYDNPLTNIDFLNTLPNPEKLETLHILNNAIQPTDISIFSRFKNIKILKMELRVVV